MCDILIFVEIYKAHLPCNTKSVVNHMCSCNTKPLPLPQLLSLVTTSYKFYLLLPLLLL